MHKAEGDRVLHRRQEIALEHADAVFGRDRSAVFLHDREDGGVYFIPAFEKIRLVGADRLADVVVDIAIAEMAERQRARTGYQRDDRRVRVLEEGRHCCDWHRYVVLDRASGMTLRLAEHLANAP